MVYDITSRTSFENVRGWLDELPNLTKSETLVMILGNKKDLADRNPASRMIQKAELTALAQERGCLYEEVSAYYDQSSIEQQFKTLVSGTKWYLTFSMVD